MKWLMENKVRVLKWAGVGLGSLLVLMAAFVGARYLASGDEFEGSLQDLAPADVVYVLHVPATPAARTQVDSFLEAVAGDSNLPLLENSALWRGRFGKSMEGGLAQFHEEKFRKGLENVARQADGAGIKLFTDLLGGELLLAADEGKDGGFVALSRVSRAVRFRWQFMDMAGAFFPDGPDAPEMEFIDGVLLVTPRAGEDSKQPRTLRITLVGDVLAVSDSPRLLDATLAARDGGQSLAKVDEYKRARALPAEEDAARFTATLWIDLDGLRARLPAEDGQSPVDAFTSLPASVVGIFPDILAPVDTIVSRNLDTTVFSGALYGIDLADYDTVRFDQYLLADSTRAADGAFEHLRETWQQPARPAGQLDILPPDTMFEVSYRQPISVLFEKVFSERDRKSLVGDFIVAVRGPEVEKKLRAPVEELLMATAPRSYAPDAVAPVSPVDLPLPAFMIGFRTTEAEEDVAGALLHEYLQAQRGRNTRSGEPAREGPVKVVERALMGRRVWALDDPRGEEGGQILPRLNRSVRCALVGEWLLLTNSESLMEFAFKAEGGQERGLARQADSAFGGLDEQSSATLYLAWDELADYVANKELFRLLREAKYNPGLVEMRDQAELRREIVAAMGLDPSDPKDMADERVAAEYARRKQVWENTCKIEGDRYVSEMQGNVRALKFFRDLALTTRFNGDHLHVKGVLRIG